MGVCHPPGRMQQPVKRGLPCSAPGGRAVSQALTCETGRHHPPRRAARVQPQAPAICRPAKGDTQVNGTRPADREAGAKISPGFYRSRPGEGRLVGPITANEPSVVPVGHCEAHAFVIPGDTAATSSAFQRDMVVASETNSGMSSSWAHQSRNRNSRSRTSRSYGWSRCPAPAGSARHAPPPAVLTVSAFETTEQPVTLSRKWTSAATSPCDAGTSCRC